MIKNNLLDKFNLSGVVGLADIDVSGDADNDMMSDPDYLRQSSDIVKEALQKGFDVLQLANGDIVTTGTKIITNQYSWDAEQEKLVKISSKVRKVKTPEDA